MNVDKKDELSLKKKVDAIGERRALLENLKKACLSRGVDYDVGKGKRIAIPLMMAPTLLDQKQLSFLHKLSETINRYMARMPSLWMKEEEIRERLPFQDAEREFLESVWNAEHERAQTLVSRNDFDMPQNPQKTVAFEPNGCSIGGIYYSSECARIVRDEVFSHPDVNERTKKLKYTSDACDLVFSQLAAHADSIGARKRFRIGIVENRDWDTGITEMPSLLKRFATLGHKAVIGDPRTLAVSRGRFKLDGETVDVLYRNMELSDFTALEASGKKLRGVREAFRQNIFVSSLAGDFDQKNLWEVLSTKAAERFVAEKDRKFLRKHLLWTRLVRERETESPDGKVVDLIEFARANRTKLVLKPNHSCGGDRVLLGPNLSVAEWERWLKKAVRDPAGWVVQRFHEGSKKTFTLGRSTKAETFYVTYGVISAPRGASILGRACVRPVVNVSRGGALVPIFKH